MVTENLQQIKVSVSSLVVRNGIYQAVLEYYDENGKRQQPWRSTGLKERGNKKQAMQKDEEISRLSARFIHKKYIERQAEQRLSFFCIAEGIA